jgi:hypothetical protein
MSKIYINNKLILDFTQKGQKKKDKMIALVRKKDYEKNGDEENFGNKNLLYDANIVIIDDYIFDKKPNRFEINVNYTQTENVESTNFAISIDCCEILVEPNEIIKKVPIYHDKKTLHELLVKNADENSVISTKEKINLLDLYTESEKIKLPSRGINCCHLNVFDLKTFLLLNRKTNKYQCPYCKRYANNLYIDGIILDFIQDKNNFDVDEILIDINHNILSYMHKETNEIINTEKNQNNIHHCKESFDMNKKFIINLAQDRHGTHYDPYLTSFFENKKFNVITNLGQIFEMMKDDINNNKKDKKNNNICLCKKNNNNNNMKLSKESISKYPGVNDDNIIHETTIYDFIGNNCDEFKNVDLFLPTYEEEVISKNVEEDKIVSFLKKRIRNNNCNNILHKNIFFTDKNINNNADKNYSTFNIYKKNDFNDNKNNYYN